MRLSILIFFAVSLTACINERKLFEKATLDEGKIIARKGAFAGTHFIDIVKKKKGKSQYSIIYICECDSSSKISLQKTFRNDDGTFVSWTSVTDTSGQPKLFNTLIQKKKISYPIEFLPITPEEISLVEEAVGKVVKTCCRKPNKPINKIIGYVKVKSRRK